MKISRMKVGSWGKLKAFFDIETQEGFFVKGFKIIDGINGYFVFFSKSMSNISPTVVVLICL